VSSKCGELLIAVRAEYFQNSVFREMKNGDREEQRKTIKALGTLGLVCLEKF
jgi:hypothetical protein